METFIIYIAKTGICLGIFLVVYTLFLRKTTFFKFNRVFLLVGFITSLVIPAIKYTYDVVVSLPVAFDTESTETVAPIAESQAISIWTILSAFYLIGISFLVIRNIYTYKSLYGLIRNGQRSQGNGYKIIENKDIKSPFTVLDYILINTSNLSNTEKELILKHEITHIDQKHWIDLLCSESMLLLQWFNPLVWVYVHLLKENHEFLADKAVIDSGISPALYQAVLINQEFRGPVFSFSNSFSYSKPLNRLNMIKKAKSASWKRIATLIVIPAFGAFIWVSATPRYIFDQPDVSEILKDSVDMNLSIITDSKDSVKQKQFIIIGHKDSVVNNTLKVQATFESDDNNPIVIVNGKLVSDAQEDNNGTISISTKKDSLNPKVTHDKIRSIQYDSDNKDNNDESITKGKPVKIRINGVGASSEELPLIIVDGKIVPNNKMSKISPDDIDQMNVLKGKSAIKTYGEEAKNGVVLIYTKEYAKDNPKSDKANKMTIIPIGSSKKSSIHVTASPDFKINDALVIIDGKEASEAELQSIDPATIESVEVFKDSSATEQYGEKGKNGVIVIKTKAPKN
ncbi:TonB-dependent SusC/RagA subfamily outer membrane receptor [Dysgonomonas sp. PFB1-18]|uniref:M56 family metallopeptidase n=1 Tax=unclassified Dysgonomonas TaxID=2630389 RepID=UPI0024735797|nr:MULTISPECIES: M56 family metallopeptidase [unclassified Dysgonomonas]MDH6309276.1 TonB-dependent SusC/RagA subfamily outer membrane receptor [Dysgonomonas sp. PF1-14]MDH6338844.1 TonB-dependent SusC/RagA subfamily outer membrane receptor [Dysgonomonas sp. PF1-16]MDH6380525.1 TonB-dependent SusC/RagA subfamily outer membrane receptor [Dysgonomonas sp. PFB1-18]MDH6397672.1 TonB-dependent SusC/RagA subfamily outer membrane receptor [Dysgonomonas sp. PF1-23]